MPRKVIANPLLEALGPFDPVNLVSPFWNAASSLLTDLAAYWKLDETSGTRNDSTANANHLTDNNTVGSNTGKISNAAEFVPVNLEFLSHTSNAVLQMGNIDFTIAFWAKMTSAGVYQLVTKDDEAGGGPNREYGVDWNSGAPRFAINGIITVVYSGGVLDIGTWYHIIAYHDATNDLIGIQINNGTADTGNTSGTSPNVGAAEFRIGAREYSGFEQYTDGLIDEVGIWKRLLTSDEKATLYNSGSGTSYPF